MSKIYHLPRKFGVEIENTASTQRAARAIATTTDVPVQNYGSGPRRTHNGPALQSAWKVVYDGSVGGGSEAVSPPLTSTESINKVCKAIRSTGGSVSRACGLHVHVDATDLTGEQIGRLVRIWSAAEDSIMSTLPHSRRNTYYSRNVADSIRRQPKWWNGTALDKGRVASLLSSYRYVSLNLHALRKHNTVEFRCHSASLNGAKISRWVALCVAMVERAKYNDLSCVITPETEWTLEETLTHVLKPHATVTHSGTEKAITVRSNATIGTRGPSRTKSVMVMIAAAEMATSQRLEDIRSGLSEDITNASIEAGHGDRKQVRIIISRFLQARKAADQGTPCRLIINSTTGFTTTVDAGITDADIADMKRYFTRRAEALSR